MLDNSRPVVYKCQPFFHLKPALNFFEERHKSNSFRRLEAKKNFIPPSESVRKEYAYVLLKEYRKYIEDRPGNGR